MLISLALLAAVLFVFGRPVDQIDTSAAAERARQAPAQ
jgi:hypothetical protein